MPILSCHTPACCNCTSLLWHKHVWIWPWMGFNWNMLRPQWEIMYKTRWSRKVAFESRKVAAGSGKVARSVFSFEGYKLPDSKTQFKGIPTSFSHSCGRRSKWPCLGLMPCIGHSPKSKIWQTKDIYIYIYIPGKKVWAVLRLLPCFVVKQLLCSLAKFFKQVNPVSPIDLREFGEKIALSLDWHI